MEVLNDQTPPWSVIESAHQVGIRQAKDCPWRYVGKCDGEIGASAPCTSQHCWPRPVDGIADIRIVFLSREHIDGYHLYIGQCRRCGFVYWGEPR